MNCENCLTESDPNNVLDNSGICSYCRKIESSSDLMEKIGNGSDLLGKKFSKTNHNGKYDCLVGFSGGKDSTYIIHRLRSFYKVKVLAFTWDNGFLTEYAMNNINSIIKELEIDHQWVKPQQKILRAMYSKNLKSEGWPCSACFNNAEVSAWKLAYENRIPFIVSGRTPEQILRQPNRYAIQQISKSLSESNKNDVIQIARQTIDRLEKVKRWLLEDSSLWPVASESLYLREDFEMPTDFAPEWINFFYYEKYDVLKIIEILEHETNWIPPSKRDAYSHSDCSAHDAAAYLFYRTHGNLISTQEISASIRLNNLDKSTGIKLMNDEIENAKRYPTNSIAELSRVTGISNLDLRLLPFKIRTKKIIKKIIRKMA